MLVREEKIENIKKEKFVNGKMVKQVFEARVSEKRTRGRPRRTWLENVRDTVARRGIK